MNLIDDVDSLTVEITEGTNVLHNMSAPPRSTITVSPLIRSTKWSLKEESQQSTSSSGLKWVMRIDLDELINSHIKNFAKSIKREFERKAASETDEYVESLVNVEGLTEKEIKDAREKALFRKYFPYLRLRSCLVICRYAAGLSEKVTFEEVNSYRDLPFESLCDELRSASALIPVPENLPSLGMVLAADKKVRSTETNAARVIYVLSRLNGTTFVNGGSAMVTGRLHGNIKHDLWVPE